MRTETRARVVAMAAALAIFFAFAGGGLGGFFAPDEMMNLYRAWSPPLRQLLWNDRPVGALVYRWMFAAFGLHPVPYRLLCFALILANLALLWRFCRLVSGSREIAALALLIGAYHAHLADLYYTSSNLFDLLCYLFYFLALTYYVAIHRPNLWHMAAIAALYILALGSKEMAVTLPAAILAYELIYRGPRAALRARWLWLAAPLTALYVVYKTTGAGRMTWNPDYAPHFTLHAWLAAWKHYLTLLFYQAVRFTDVLTIGLLVGLLVLALAARRRALLLGWCLITVGALPVSFIVPRGLFAIYLTLPGWYLYAAETAAMLRDRLHRAVPRLAAALGVEPRQAALFAGVAAVAIALHLREKPAGNSWVAAAFDQTRPLLRELEKRYPAMPRGARLLFLSDPCPPNDYILYFLCALRYRDKDIHVYRAKDNPALAVDPLRAGYDHVFLWGPAGLLELGRD